MKYKTSLVIISVSLIILVAVLDAFLTKIVFKRCNITLDTLFYLLAFIAAAYYAHITKKMWESGKDPVLRLQWHDIGATEQQPFKMYREKKSFNGNSEESLRTNIEKQIRVERDRAKTYFEIYNSFTNLQLVNDGQGIARDLKIKIGYLYQNKIICQVKRVTAMGSGPNSCTQLKYLEHPGINRHQVFNDEFRSYKEPFRVVIEYKDAQDEDHAISFVSDERYNDGFRIEKSVNKKCVGQFNI